MIRIQDLSVAFRSPVLDGVSLHAPAASILALVGPGASGKSVLLKSVAGLLRPDRGEVFVNDVALGDRDEAGLAEVRKGIGMLFQNYALFDYLTVGENIAFPLRRLFDLPEEEIQERVTERLVRVSLPGFEERIPRSLSGGQKKRVGIARATVARAPILLYDDPTAGLDPVTSQKIYDLIKGEQREQQSCVMVISSDVAGILSIADRVAMLHQGRIAFDGTAEEARTSQDPLVRQFIHGLLEGPL
ncbi:MAG: ATP-binding cassette domain-containing protein [Deltaproteobacteria bacterium]|nr:ATP-binding cassette domain-containing protein [Deltaproteobacteria bacterium]